MGHIDSFSYLTKAVYLNILITKPKLLDPLSPKISFAILLVMLV